MRYKFKLILFVIYLLVIKELSYILLMEVLKNIPIILEELIGIRSGIMNLINKLKGLITHKDVIYSSAICSDCQLAEEFFQENNIDIDIKKIEEPQYRKELKEKHGRVLVPTIILDNEKFIGFEANQEKIKKKLGMH